MHDRRVVEIGYVLLRSGLVAAVVLGGVHWGLPRVGVSLASAAEQALVVLCVVAASVWGAVSLLRFESAQRQGEAAGTARGGRRRGGH